MSRPGSRRSQRVRVACPVPALVGLLALSLGVSCASSSHRRSNEEPGALHGGWVVSRVNGSGITVAEVERLARRGGLSASAALSRLQAERLLEQEAARRGYGEDFATLETARKAQVQALLAREVESQSVSEQEIAAQYARDGERWHTPEQRAGVHVLAALPKNAGQAAQQAARTFAESATAELIASDDLKATLHALGTAHSKWFNVRVESLPLLADDGSLVPAFARAYFALPAAGVVPEPVHTQYGWHAIVVTNIRPARSVSLSEARPVLARELTDKKRKRRLDALLAQLRAGTHIVYADTSEQALATLDF